MVPSGATPPAGVVTAPEGVEPEVEVLEAPEEPEDEVSFVCARAVPWASTSTKATLNAAQARKNPGQILKIGVIVWPPTTLRNDNRVTGS